MTYKDLKGKKILMTTLSSEIDQRMVIFIKLYRTKQELNLVFEKG